MPERPLGVSLWCVALDDAPAPPPGLLAGDEVARAARFAFAHDRRRYEAAHAALRQVLAAELGLPPAHRFATGADGKPLLPAALQAGFSLSHSGGWALIGLRRGAAVGVDIEQLQTVDTMRALAEEHFSEAELQAWRAIDDVGAASRAFLRAWTRKEACLKALGCGLRVVLRTVDVGVQPQPRMVAVDVDSALAVVEVVTVEPQPGVIGAVAVVQETMREADVNDAN